MCLSDNSRLLGQSATAISSAVINLVRLPVQTPLKERMPGAVQAVRSFLSSETWHKNPSWWTGWRWTVARDA